MTVGSDEIARIPLSILNDRSCDDFVAALRGIYEHSPWIAERSWERRPFASRFALHEALQTVVYEASTEEQLGLIRAHPELAGKAAVRGELTAESTQEQAGAGLGACSQEEFDRLQQLNAGYNDRFGFPFILAVKGHTRRSIIAAFEERLANDTDTERATAIDQIGRIAMFRLWDRVSEPLGDTIMAMAERLARHSESPDMLTCTYLSHAHRSAARLLRDWMWAAGLSAHIDAVGNVVGRYVCGQTDAKTLLTGSHYDTVVNGGAYDGRLGILLPIAVVEALRHAGKSLPVDLEIVAFCDEEGVRFDSTYLGSRAISGQFDLTLLDRTDRNGITLRQALNDAHLDPDGITALPRARDTLAGYVEVHIEQGPQLLDLGVPVGVVTAINGNRRFLLRITGEAGHAGTVPMHLRRDAAVAAAELIVYIEQRCERYPGLVGTVGRLSVPNGAVNVIPGACELSIDVRAPVDRVRDAAVDDIRAKAIAIGAARRVQMQFSEVLNGSATPCDDGLRSQLSDAVRRVTGNLQPRQLPSGAGHDAVPMAALTPIAMLFVRCGNGGISHNPREILTTEDADISARVFEDFLLHFRTDP